MHAGVEPNKLLIGFGGGGEILGGSEVLARKRRKTNFLKNLTVEGGEIIFA